jgi:Asp/Glu/hydantoin racemase
MHLGFLHASRAAVDPIAHYYSAHQPHWTFTHLLDDGIMRHLHNRDWAAATNRLQHHLADLQATYGIDAALITCSALPINRLTRLQSGIPVTKIDVPMAQTAVTLGDRIGILSTFPATRETTRDLLTWAANGVPKEFVEVSAPAALTALLAGDTITHDAAFLDAVAAFQNRVDVLVLAQVSMARLAPQAAALLGIPVLDSLSSSLQSFLSTEPTPS